MTGILDRMRNTTVADLDKITGDFSDVASAVYVPRKPKDMQRIVEGADDLKVNRPAPKNPGMVKAGDWNGANTEADRTGLPTERQSAFMISLIGDLLELDGDLWQDAIDYTRKMNNARAWNPARGENASRWIDRLKAKVAELRAARPTSPYDRNGDADAPFQDIPNGYYAVADADEDDIHFFRVSRFRDGGIKVQEQASDTLHPVRRGGRRTAILTTIQHVGPEAAARLYGRTIGRCGRCNRTLTDATSRARGIGPDCEGKM